MNYFKGLTIHVLLFIFPYFIFISLSFAEELSDCADNLVSLQNSVKEASKAAQDEKDAEMKFEDKRSKLEDKKAELDECIDYPISHDPYHDNCETLKAEYNNAVDDYLSARNEFQSALDTLKSRLSEVEDKMSMMKSSCGTDLSDSFQSQDDEQSRQDDSPECNFVMKFRGELPDKVILEICAKHFSFDKCVTCLELN